MCSGRLEIMLFGERSIQISSDCALSAPLLNPRSLRFSPWPPSETSPCVLCSFDPQMRVFGVPGLCDLVLHVTNERHTRLHVASNLGFHWCKLWNDR